MPNVESPGPSRSSRPRQRLNSVVSGASPRCAPWIRSGSNGSPCHPSFYLEIGTEELPGVVRDARAALDEGKRHRPGGAGPARHGPPSRCTRWGRPRRLALRLRGLAPSQPDRDESIMGPPWSAAFEADGSPKKAATGFAKKHGVAVEDLRKQTTDKGDYVSVQVHETGKQTARCSRTSFRKSVSASHSPSPCAGGPARSHSVGRSTGSCRYLARTSWVSSSQACRLAVRRGAIASWPADLRPRRGRQLRSGPRTGSRAR